MFHRLLGRILILGLALAAVATGAVAKSQLRIVVFSDDADKGRELLDKLAARGYSNPDSKIEANPNREFNIKYGAAPYDYIDEIATYTEGRYDVEMRRSREFDSTDLDVFINLPFETQAGTNADRASLRVVVFTDDEEQGDELLATLRGMGYTNEDNYVNDEPQSDPEVEYGSAAPVIVDEIVTTVLEDYDVELAARRAFEPDDDDVFISLPVLTAAAVPDRGDIEITVFAANQKTGNDVLKMLADIGFLNESNEVLASPNDNFNIKHGACPAEYIGEIKAALEQRFKQDFLVLEEFGEDQRKVFINIPGK